MSDKSILLLGACYHLLVGSSDTITTRTNAFQRIQTTQKLYINELTPSHTREYFLASIDGFNAECQRSKRLSGCAPSAVTATLAATANIDVAGSLAEMPIRHSSKEHHWRISYTFIRRADGRIAQRLLKINQIFKLNDGRHFDTDSNRQNITPIHVAAQHRSDFGSVAVAVFVLLFNCSAWN